MITKFSQETKDAIKFYVYRLVDPITGQTFYVGKGQGDRIFEHVKASDNFYKDYKNEFNFEEDEDPAKLKMIREIKQKGLDVIHVIQRFGLDKNTALEIEAAFIDFFGLEHLTNQKRGSDSDRGMIWADELEQKYMADEFDDYPDNPNCPKFMIIKINDRSINLSGGDIYEAVRKSWIVVPKTANKYPYVLAVKHGIVIGVYRVHNWEKTQEGDRAFFTGEPAKEDIKKYFFKKRIPEKYIKRQNPISYCAPKKIKIVEQ